MCLLFEHGSQNKHKDGMNILEQIIADKRHEISERKKMLSLEAIQAEILSVENRPDFIQALRAGPLGLIAEVKRMSPSAGLIREPFDPASIACEYESSGASAVSCLMDQKYFGGGEEDFSAVRSAIDLPMLYKEFVIDSWQIAHAKVSGASAILLIAGALTNEELSSYIEESRGLTLHPLVEVHDREEMRRALDAGAELIGINNRNLKTFETKLDTTYQLVGMSPSHCTLVSESGIKTSRDVVRLKDAGVHAILVGESLLREVSPGAAARDLMNLV
jgi:indole-3-glycerol phosphate synthase